MFRNLRAILSLRRLPLRTEAHLSRNAEEHTVRRVRFLRPAFTASRFNRGLLWLTAGSIIYNLVLPAIFEREDEEDEEDEAHEEAHDQGQEDDDHAGEPPIHGGSLTGQKPDEDPLFIPLGWAKRCKVKPYKGSDPEWQEYVKFSYDIERGLKIRRELAGMVGVFCKQNKNVSSRLGDELVVTKWWLDLDFPDAPPPEYERSGIEIADRHVTWTRRKVTARNYFRLQHALWPTSVTNSFWTTFTVIYPAHLAKLKRLFNLETKEEQKARQAAWELFKDISKARAQIEKGSQTSSMQATASDAKESLAKQTPAPTETTRAALPKSTRGGLPPLVPPPNSGDISYIGSLFRSALAKSWRPPPPVAPRGCIFVTGLVEIVGTKSLCLIDARAAYNPKTSKWEVVTLHLRRVAERNQAPKGGY